MTDTPKTVRRTNTLAAFAAPGPLGAILLATCAIVGMITGAENASAITPVLLVWLALWGFGRALGD